MLWLSLAAVRQSSLSNAEKNELRDLVFYTPMVGRRISKIALEHKLKLIRSIPVPPVAKSPEIKSEPPKPPLPFGTYRPAPVFEVPVVSKTAPKIPVSETKPESVPVEVAKVKEEVKPAVATR